ncbi:MAG: hypothetical protein HY858_15805 [Candidatus Solibacter usitatus]|nr:hypothetical protein [Candidatus Solibacter usitatus]
MAGLEKLGHVAGPTSRGAASAASPGNSTGYAAAHNRAALLVESHSLKSFRTRVWSHYGIMRISIDIVASSARSARAAAVAADRAEARRR